MSFREEYKNMIDDLQPSSELSNKLLKNQEDKIVKFNKKKSSCNCFSSMHA